MLTLILILSSALPTQTRSDPPKGKLDGRGKADVAAATPEQALRTFFIALLDQDEATLHAVTVPTDDFAWLLRGQPVPAAHVKALRAQMASQPIRALKPGDKITLPGNRKGTVPPEDVTTDRAVLLPKWSPVPTRVWRINGRWRVDANWIIAGRKAAESARKEASQPTR